MATATWQKIVSPIPFPSASYAIGTYYMASAHGGVDTTGTKQSYGTNDAWNALDLTLVTGASGSGTVILRLEGYDPASATWVLVPGATTLAIAQNASQPFLVCPGTIETANVRVSWTLPIRWRLRAVVASLAIPFSVGGRMYRV